MELEPPRPGSTVIVQKVRPGCETDYREWSRRINSACAEAAGFVDLEVFEPNPEDEQSFVIVLRFETAAQLDAWQESPRCRHLLEEAKPLLKQDVRHGPSSVYGSWFKGKSGPSREPTKPWKEALVVLLALYPTVMLLTLYVTGPLLKSWSMATGMYVSNLISVALLTWVLMPPVTTWLSFWLNPAEGSGPRARYGGLALVLSAQWLMVALFHHFLPS